MHTLITQRDPPNGIAQASRINYGEVTQAIFKHKTGRKKHKIFKIFYLKRSLQDKNQNVTKLKTYCQINSEAHLS